ncbi:NTP transferase domain-containing protein [Caldisericum exile]|uniref:Uncharacterized protein n=1 Tax=Caldisericum exile (strain DSM 21853 / NBRC 104410 / AZM16c01) TaxID=511051 RepID=A0A7U6GFU5_CALEA|nr:NTP transferase domain-containing protein [Caldisericum exile]BAL81624.1 hypothetical protein CSE_14980 [Caldisericum exile AZM16c01]
MKVNIGNTLEVEFFGRKASYKREEKLIYESVLPSIREAVSFIILYSKGFDLERAINIANEIEKLSNEYYPDIIFVVGSVSHLNAIKKVYDKKFYKCVISEKVYAPIFSSFKLGLRLVSPYSIGSVLILGSRQIPEAHILIRLIEQLRKGSKIVVPVKDGKPTHPIAFNKLMFDELATLRKEKGIPYILKRYEELIELVEI